MCRRVVRGDMSVVLVAVVVGVDDELWMMVGEEKVGRMFVLVCGMWIFAVFLGIEEWKSSCGWRIFAARRVIERKTRRCERSS